MADYRRRRRRRHRRAPPRRNHDCCWHCCWRQRRGHPRHATRLDGGRHPGPGRRSRGRRSIVICASRQRRLGACVASAPAMLATFVSALSAGYLGVLTIAAASQPARRESRRAPLTRFVLMVPAHDEESVIADTLESFKQLAYDRAHFAVHVVADNCTDRTAAIV